MKVHITEPRPSTLKEGLKKRDGSYKEPSTHTIDCDVVNRGVEIHISFNKLGRLIMEVR